MPTNAAAPKLRLVSLLPSEGTSHTNKEDNKKQRRAASDCFFFPFFFAKSSHRMYTIYTHAHTHSTGRQHDGRMRQREFPPESSRPRPPPPRRNRGVSPFRHSHRTLRIGTETREGFTVGRSPSERQRGARNTHEPPPGHRRQKGRRHVGMFSMPGV